MRRSMAEELKPKALKFLENAEIPVGVGDVAHALNVSWSTARQVLMELLIEGRVKCQKTAKSRIFRIKRDGS